MPFPIFMGGALLEAAGITGIYKSISGVLKLSEAKNIVEDAANRYKKRLNEVDNKGKEVKNDFNEPGNLKIRIETETVSDFIKEFKKSKDNNIC